MVSNLDWQTREHAAGRSAQDRFSDLPVENDDAWGGSASSMLGQVKEAVLSRPGYLVTAGFALLAAGSGMAVGYWLGGRREARRRRTMGFSADDLGNYARLAPIAANLLKNPVVRSYLARTVVRQLNNYLDA